MGKLLPDLDLRLGRLQQSYQNSYSQGDYELAADWLYQLNASLPTRGRITNLRRCEPKKANFGQKLEASQAGQYKAWCMKHAPYIFNAVSDYVDEMLQAYGGGQ